MSRRVVICVALSGTIVAATTAALNAQVAGGAQEPAGALRYPPTPRGPVVDDLGGVKIPDPYRWLENITSTEVRNWISAENAVTEGYFARNSRRAGIRDLVTRMWMHPKLGVPFVAGDRLFFFDNAGLENQPTLYVRDRLAPLPRVLIDPNMFSSEGLIAIVDQAASPDGRYLAYAVSTQGSAWRSVRIRDVRTGQDLDDELTGIKQGPLAWTSDERGFFYVRSDVANPAEQGNPLAVEGRQRVYYHRVGRQQSDDRLIYENAEHPECRIRAEVSDDGQFFVVSIRTGTELNNRLYFIDLDNPKRPNLSAPLVKLFDANDAAYEFVASEGPVFYVRTSKNAPRGQFVAVDINSPDPSHWTPLIRETYDPLVAVTRVDDRWVAQRLREAHSVLELYSLDGGVRGTVQLPGIGTVTELRADAGARQFYLAYASFLQPPTIYRYDLDSRALSPYRNTGADDLTAGYETTQLFFTSKDGTRVPLFITARRGITLDGTHPTLLSSGPGFGIAATPTFDPTIAAWLELGGVYAVANVRGGGEDGRAWHTAAIGQRKQVAIDDFTSAAEFLIGQRYTRSSSLGVVARGRGALVAEAAVIQRPELFGAMAVDGGLSDAVRYPRFTAGRTWVPEFGSPDRPADLRAILAYSPVQNIRSGKKYPPMLITTGDRSDEVVPLHSYKLAASLQAAQPSTIPALLKVDYDSGDGPGIPTANQRSLAVDQLTFFASALRVPQP